MIAVGLGGNIGGHAALVTRFRAAREALEQLGAVRSARLYRTAPIGPVQPAFLNTAVRVDVADATPSELIHTLLEIERLLGRDRSTETRFGPRMIDLDILVWDDRVLRTPELEVPHPRLCERRFALVPLIDLFGEAYVVAGTKQTLGALERRVAGQTVEEVSATW